LFLFFNYFLFIFSQNLVESAPAGGVPATDQAALSVAHEAMRDVADFINEVKRDHEASKFFFRLLFLLTFRGRNLKKSFF
jgi:hypothetical protein